MAGRPVLMHTIDAFRNALPDSRIILVLSHSAMDLWQTLCREYGFESPEIVAGGASRAESVANALEAAAPLTDSTVVMIHDGARPMASPEMLHRLRLAVDIRIAGRCPCRGRHRLFASHKFRRFIQFRRTLAVPCRTDTAMLSRRHSV